MSDVRPEALKALLFASSAAGMLCATPVLADAETTPAPAVDQSQATTTLSAIDVHGQRQRREPSDPQYVAPLVDTPRAVTVIPHQIIEQQPPRSRTSCAPRPASPLAQARAASPWPTGPSSVASPRATTSSSTASATAAASSARSSTWNRSRSSRAPIPSIRGAARAGAASTSAPRPRACRPLPTPAWAQAPTAICAARSMPTGRCPRRQPCA